MTVIVCISHTQMYSEAMHEVVRKIDDVRSIEKHIYTNVLALMAVFVAVFSIISVNVSLVSKEKLDLTILLVFNLCTIGAIGFLVSITKSLLSPKCTMIISGFSLLPAPVLSICN